METLRKAVLPATSHLLARAFAETSSYAAIFPERAGREVRLRRLFASNLALHARAGCVFVRREGGRVVATATLRPPGGVGAGLVAALRTGFPWLLLRSGPATARRMLAMGAAYDRLEEEITGGGAHRYLHMMAAEPSAQGKGSGSRLLADVLADASRTDALPVALATQSPDNLRFYERAGFHLVDERIIDGPFASHRTWSMLRPPDPSRRP